jgi:hypothetical protein
LPLFFKTDLMVQNLSSKHDELARGISRLRGVSFGDPGAASFFFTPLLHLPLEQDAPRVALALQQLDCEKRKILSHQICLKNSCKIAVRRRRRANLSDNPKNIPAGSSIQPRANDL